MKKFIFHRGKAAEEVNEWFDMCFFFFWLTRTHVRVSASSKKTENKRRIFVFKSLRLDPKVCHKNPPAVTCP